MYLFVCSSVPGSVVTYPGGFCTAFGGNVSLEMTNDRYSYSVKYTVVMLMPLYKSAYACEQPQGVPNNELCFNWNTNAIAYTVQVQYPY